MLLLTHEFVWQKHRIWCELGYYTNLSPTFPLSQINQQEKGEGKT